MSFLITRLSYATHALVQNETLVYAVGFTNISENSNVYKKHYKTFKHILIGS